jgi:hypothetical protein
VFELLLLLKSCEQSVAAASTLQYAACQYLSLLLLCVELGVLVLSYYCDCVADGLVECKVQSANIYSSNLRKQQTARLRHVEAGTSDDGDLTKAAHRHT